MFHSIFSKAPGASEVGRIRISILTIEWMKSMLRKAKQCARAT